MSELTTVSVTKITKNELTSIGHKGQTYDSIIQLLLKEWGNKNAS